MSSSVSAALQSGNSMSPERLGPLKAEMLSTFAELRPGLESIERKVVECLQSEYHSLTDISSYLFGLGGKRIRPILTLLTGRLFGLSTPSTQLIDAAAGIELIHMATLLHDDIIDDAETRRRQQSAFRKFGLAQTLLTGDFLLVKAFGLCARLDRFIIEATEHACIELTEGEAMEGILSPNSCHSLDTYFTIARKKTASLFALASAVGSFSAEASEASIHSMRDFGYHCGIAFQIVDDILDITANEDLLGKAAGTDLRQKTPSIVNVLWLESGDPKAAEFFRQPTVSRSTAAEAAAELRTSPVIEECRRIAKETAEKAKQSLYDATEPTDSDSRIRHQLEGLLEYTLQRCL